MMKVLLKIVLFLFLLVNNLYSGSIPDYRLLSLDEFVGRVSQANNINIFIDEDLTQEKISFYVPNVKSPKILLEAFKIAVNKKGLNFLRKDDFYYLSKKKEYKIRNYIFKLSYNCSDDFKKYLDLLDLKYSYFQSNNSFIVKCNYLQRKEVAKFLKDLDKQAKQIMLKFYILSYDDNLGEC